MLILFIECLVTFLNIIGRYKNIKVVIYKKKRTRLSVDRQNRTRRVLDARGSSNYLGVSWIEGRKCYSAHIEVKGKQHHLGQYINEIDAAKAYDKALRYFYGQTIKTNLRGVEAQAPEVILLQAKKQFDSVKPKINRSTKLKRTNKTQDTSSKYIGVYYNKAKNKFCATISVDNKKQWLGSYNLEDEAAKAYNLEAAKYGKVLNVIS